MKDMLKILGIFTILTTMIPMLVFLIPPEQSEHGQADINSTELAEEQTVTITDSEFFSVLDCNSGNITEMTMLEYVVGAVLGEMPASFHDEAIKAQAVAVHTYAVRRIAQQQKSPSPELKGAFISNDSTRYQAYFSPEQAEYFYGKDYEEINERITALAEEVIDELIVYDGEPIVAAFHSSSCGITESAENVWGSAVPYLVPVESDGDTISPNFTVETNFTSAELEARFSQKYDTVFPKNKASWFKIDSTSPSGTVLSLSAGDTTLSGTEARSLLSLRSACFTVRYDEDSDSFIFTSKGNGHGVGLSQYGANAMAEKGADYRQILTHYYKGAEVISVNSNV